MTNIERFIRDTIEGGLVLPDEFMWQHPEKVLLMPESWQAVGKVRKWEIREELAHPDVYADEWFMKMHDMIDSLASGKSLEDSVPGV